jgi:rhodanese-related sulfurtransferase
MTRVIAAFAFALLALSAAADDIATMTAETLRQRLAATEGKPLVVDVREVDEFEAAHIAEAQIAPLGKVEESMANIAKDREIVLVCRSGRRSGLAYKRLAAQGFTRLWNMEGGMIAWEKLGYPVEKKP